MILASAVSSQYTRVTDDRQTGDGRHCIVVISGMEQINMINDKYIL